MPSNELQLPAEAQRSGDSQISQRTEPTFDVSSLLQEGQPREQRANIQEATEQAVQQGILPDLEISNLTKDGRNESPATESPAEPRADGETSASPSDKATPPAVEEPGETKAPEPEAAAQPQERQPARRGSIRPGLVGAAQAATSGAYADIEVGETPRGRESLQ